MEKTDAELVREFTRAAGKHVPNHPHEMSHEEVSFLIRMMLDELMELYSTVTSEYKKEMIDMIMESRNLSYNPDLGNVHKIAEQADALVDCYYYSLDAMAKKGINLSKIFKLVHNANMAKRDVNTGLFIKDERGKVIKPVGWQPPCISDEIQRQINHGSFEHKHD